MNAYKVKFQSGSQRTISAPTETQARRKATAYGRVKSIELIPARPGYVPV